MYEIWMPQCSEKKKTKQKQKKNQILIEMFMWTIRDYKCLKADLDGKIFGYDYCTQ